MSHFALRRWPSPYAWLAPFLSSTGRRSSPVIRRRALQLIVLAATLLFDGVSLSAQRAPDGWRVTGEVGGVLGGTWLRGVGAPTVTTDPGATIGVGATRQLVSGVSAGATLRIGAQPVVMREVGATWSGGTLTEADVLAQLIVMSAQGTTLRPALEVGVGAAVLTGARDVLPFHDASRVAPIAEAGFSVRRDANSSTPQDLALFVHYGIVRLDASGTNAVTSSGWVRRVTLGLRVTR